MCSLAPGQQLLVYCMFHTGNERYVQHDMTSGDLGDMIASMSIESDAFGKCFTSIISRASPMGPGRGCMAIIVLAP